MTLAIPKKILYDKLIYSCLPGYIIPLTDVVIDVVSLEAVVADAGKSPTV